MKKILFPTDFSTHAKQVFQYAVVFAKFFDAEITLLHSITDSEMKMLENQNAEERGLKVIAQLSDFAKQHIPKAYGTVKYTCLAAFGHSQEAILRVAKEESIDLIVLGMQGANNTIDKILGSISTAIIKEADCPVLAIPTNATFSAINYLVYTLDFEFRDLVAINLLKEWGSFLKANIHCLHAMEKDETKEIVFRNIETLYELYNNKKREIGKITFEILRGKLEKVVLDFTESVEVDVLVMATHKRGLVKGLLQENTTVKIANKIQVPLLILKIE